MRSRRWRSPCGHPGASPFEPCCRPLKRCAVPSRTAAQELIPRISLIFLIVSSRPKTPAWAWRSLGRLWKRTAATLKRTMIPFWAKPGSALPCLQVGPLHVRPPPHQSLDLSMGALGASSKEGLMAMARASISMDSKPGGKSETGEQDERKRKR
jgi:hypothetical protein